VTLALPILNRILEKIYPDPEQRTALRALILHGIYSHDLNPEPLTLEAGITAVADGTDITKGRGRKATGSEKGDPLPPAPWSWTVSRWSRAKLVPCKRRKKGAPGKRWGEKGQREKAPDPNGHGGRLLKVFVHPANEHDKWGGRALLAGMDLSLWPRARKLFVDWGYRGLKETASSLGLELEVVARPYAGYGGSGCRRGRRCRRFRGSVGSSLYLRGGWWRGPLPG
jgi:hypothetical protein